MFVLKIQTVSIVTSKHIWKLFLNYGLWGTFVWECMGLKGLSEHILQCYQFSRPMWTSVTYEDYTTCMCALSSLNFMSSFSIRSSSFVFSSIKTCSLECSRFNNTQTKECIYTKTYQHTVMGVNLCWPFKELADLQNFPKYRNDMVIWKARQYREGVNPQRWL